MSTQAVPNSDQTMKSANQVGFYASIATVAFTLLTFGFAIVAIPISGANCLEGCIDYPYLDTLAQFPKDYRWMVPAILLMLIYLITMVSIHQTAAQEKKIFSLIGLCFALMSTLVLVSDYFIQFSVIPISLMHGETEGITLLTQYNAHGIFIVLEELGYLLMSLSFPFFALVFTPKNRLEGAIRWVFLAGFGLALLALAVVTLNHGLNRQDRFEVMVISIDWLVLVINGILLSIVFRKRLKGQL